MDGQETVETQALYRSGTGQALYIKELREMILDQKKEIEELRASPHT